MPVVNGPASAQGRRGIYPDAGTTSLLVVAAGRIRRNGGHRPVVVEEDGKRSRAAKGTLPGSARPFPPVSGHEPNTNWTRIGHESDAFWTRSRQRRSRPTAASCHQGRRSASKILWVTSSRIWTWLDMPCCLYTLTGLHDPRFPYQDAIPLYQEGIHPDRFSSYQDPLGNCLRADTAASGVQSRIRGRFWPKSAETKMRRARPTCRETPPWRGRGGRREAIGCRAGRRGGLASCRACRGST